MPYLGDLYFGEKFTFMNVYGTVETIAQKYQGWFVELLPDAPMFLYYLTGLCNDCAFTLWHINKFFTCMSSTSKVLWSLLL
jgi:hypothetical protein